ncbi:MAG: hypothetical protein J0I65_19200 [Variovorax sp.]|nr:hypothetical protein [Variovorax sp.]
MGDLVDRARQAVEHGEGHDHQGSPSRRDLAEVVMPEARCGKRQDRNRQQDADEREHPGEAEMTPVDCRCLRAGGKNGHCPAEGEHEREDEHRGGSERCELSGHDRGHTM